LYADLHTTPNGVIVDHFVPICMQHLYCNTQ
jgi:hypothetical protein